MANLKYNTNKCLNTNSLFLSSFLLDIDSYSQCECDIDGYLPSDSSVLSQVLQTAMSSLFLDFSM